MQGGFTMDIVSMGWTSETHTILSGIIGTEIWQILRNDIINRRSFFSQGSTRLNITDLKL